MKMFRVRPGRRRSTAERMARIPRRSGGQSCHDPIGTAKIGRSRCE
jgi:hypothetical protein